MQISALKKIFVISFSTLITACTLPLNTNISRVEITRSSHEVYNVDGTAIPTLKIAFRLTEEPASSADTTIQAYRCGHDQADFAIGGAHLYKDSNGSYLFFLPVFSKNNYFKDYDLRAAPFDICLYLVTPAYPLHRESGQIRITADEVAASFR